MALPELVIQEVSKYIDQIENWYHELYPLYRNNKGVLVYGFESALQQRLIERAYREIPRALPLIYDRLGARPDLVVQAIREESIGVPMLDSDVIRDLHISGSTRWLTLGKSDQLQTMTRLLLAEEGKLVIRDVYSDPISPMVIPDGGMNVKATVPSRSLRLITHTEASNAAVLGWIRVSETD